MLRGSNIRISQGGKLVALCTSCKISCTTNTEDAAVKTDASSKAVAEANWDTPNITGKSWSITVDKFYDTTGSLFTTDKTALLADTNVAISFTLGGFTFSGNAILSGDQINGQNRQNATGSLTFTGNGALSYAAAS